MTDLKFTPADVPASTSGRKAEPNLFTDAVKGMDIVARGEDGKGKALSVLVDGAPMVGETANDIVKKYRNMLSSAVKERNATLPADQHANVVRTVTGVDSKGKSSESPTHSLLTFSLVPYVARKPRKVTDNSATV